MTQRGRLTVSWGFTVRPVACYLTAWAQLGYGLLEQSLIRTRGSGWCHQVLGPGWNFCLSTIIVQLFYSYRNWFYSHFTMVMGMGEQKVVGSRTEGDTEGDVRCSHSGNLTRVVKMTFRSFCIILEEMFLM